MEGIVAEPESKAKTVHDTHTGGGPWLWRSIAATTTVPYLIRNPIVCTVGLILLGGWGLFWPTAFAHQMQGPDTLTVSDQAPHVYTRPSVKHEHLAVCKRDDDPLAVHRHVGYSLAGKRMGVNDPARTPPIPLWNTDNRQPLGGGKRYVM